MANCELTTTSADDMLFRELREDPIIVFDTDDKDVKKRIANPDVSLADGMPLPKYLRNDFPDSLFGKPIYEIDPFYDKKNTFVVIGTNWVIHRFSSLKSLWMLKPLNVLRWFCIRTITHWAFRYFMITTVLVYAFFHHSMTYIEWHMPFLAIFAVEINLKIVARGFVLQPFSYLRNPWNWIDFLLTQIGLSLSSTAPFLHPFHSLRILRLIHFYTHSRLTCSWMFRSLSGMKDPFLFGAFMFFLFTIYAQLFLMGVLSNRCIKETLVPIKPLVYHNVTYVAPGLLNTNMTEVRLVILPYVCGNVSGSRECPTDSFVCKEGVENPDNGYTNFDNFPMAAMSIMRLMARDFWDKLYMQIHSAVGAKEFPFIMTVIVYGGCYYVNLLLAYIAVGITELLQILEGKKPKQKRVKAKSSELSSDDTADLAKENVSNGIEEKDLVQVVDIPMSDIAAANHTKEDEGDAIVLDQPDTSVQIDQKHDGDIEEEARYAYRHRRGPLANFCMPLIDCCCDWKCCPCWVRFRNKFTAMVESIYFNVFIGICIVLNVVAWILPRHTTGHFDEWVIYHIIEIVTAFIFIIEAILKIIGLSPRQYFKDSMNVLDFFIVLAILFNIVVYNPLELTILRLFRVFRILRMASWWPYLSNLMKICGTNVWSLLVLISTFAIMAVAIFADNYTLSNLMNSRWNFYSLWNSMLTVFRMLCGEWIEPLWECLSLSNGWYCIPYFFTVILVGNLALFTLFVTMLAVALKSNNLSETEPVNNRNLISITKNFICSVCSRFRLSKRLPKQTASKSGEELFNMSANEEAKVSVTQPTLGMDMVAPCWCDSCYKLLPCCGSTSGSANHTPFWRIWGSFRIGSLRLLHNRYFDYGMNTFIILSCITQAWNDHKLDTVFLHTAFYVMNYFVIIIYPLEICLQLLGHGCKTYFTDRWHLLDFLITMLHVISMVVTSSTGAFLVPLGFRPLKLISRLKRLRVVISATLYKLSSLVDVLLACSILWLFFAVFGVSMFLEAFYSCRDHSGLIDFDVFYVEDCMYKADNGANVSWQNSEYHFDDVGSAFVSLIQVASKKGWITIMHNAIGNVHFQDDFRFFNSLYFYTFFILGVLCCFTFILATFLRKTNVQQKQVGGYIEILMSELQRQEFAQKKNNFFVSPVKVSPCPEWWPRRLAYQLVFSSKFKLMVILFTTFNAIGLASITLQASNLLAKAIFDIDVVFFVVFALEVLLRIAAFGRNFFARHWNIYDLVVLTASFLGFVPSPLLFGLFRIVRLARWLKWVRRIGSRLMLYLPALNNVALLLLVVILTYGTMAFTIYRQVPFNVPEVGHLGFTHFGTAMMSVTMMGFGSSWDLVIQNYEGSRWLVLSFLAIFYLIVLQAGAVLFLEHYHLLEEKRRLGLTDDALETFEKAWKILDPDATGYIPYDDLSEFLNTMLPPLKICHPNEDEIATMDVPIYKGDNVAFNDVLMALLARLDDHETNALKVVQKRDDVISSTLQRHQEAVAANAGPELEEN